MSQSDFIISARSSSAVALSLNLTGLLGSPASFIALNRACRNGRQPLRPMFEAAPSVTSPLSLCRAAASGHQCANAVAAAKAYEDYKHERNERGHQNTPEESCLTYWSPKRREYERARLGPKTGVQYATQTRCPAMLKSMRAAATPSGSRINVTCGGAGDFGRSFAAKSITVPWLSAVRFANQTIPRTTPNPLLP